MKLQCHYCEEESDELFDCPRCELPTCMECFSTHEIAGVPPDCRACEHQAEMVQWERTIIRAHEEKSKRWACKGPNVQQVKRGTVHGCITGRWTSDGSHIQEIDPVTREIRDPEKPKRSNVIILCEWRDK